MTGPRSSKAEPVIGSALPELVEVGRILRPHGVRGELVVESWSEHEGRFVPGEVLLSATGAPLELAAVRHHHGRLLVRLKGVDDPDQAERLRGVVLLVRRDQVPPPPGGTYYHFELIGCRVEDLHSGLLGVVAGVVEDGGGELLHVVQDGGEVLLPFVGAYLVRVDVEGRLIEVNLPEGLLETCASTS
ncbi:MAG TPA: ribosome maturation factor RimM [Thermoanaerobaculia bacterium]|nr:ribosome maturation factor RimM [Thermoanaerobaculia bacterium]